MNFLRRMSTSHLLALCAAVVALGAGMTAITVRRRAGHGGPLGDSSVILTKLT